MTEICHTFLCMDIKIATLTGLASALGVSQAPWVESQHETGWLSRNKKMPGLNYAYWSAAFIPPRRVLY